MFCRKCSEIISVMLPAVLSFSIHHTNLKLHLMEDYMVPLINLLGYEKAWDLGSLESNMLSQLTTNKAEVLQHTCIYIPDLVEQLQCMLQEYHIKCSPPVSDT